MSVEAEEVSGDPVASSAAKWSFTPVGRCVWSLLLLVTGIAIAWIAADLWMFIGGDREVRLGHFPPTNWMEEIAIRIGPAIRLVPIWWAAIVLALPIGKLYLRGTFCLLLAAGCGYLIHLTDPMDISLGPNRALLQATFLAAQFAVVFVAALCGRFGANLIQGAHRSGAAKFSLSELLATVLLAAIFVGVAKTVAPLIKSVELWEMGMIVITLLVMQCLMSLMIVSGPIIAWMLPGRKAKRVTILVTIFVTPPMVAALAIAICNLVEGFDFSLASSLTYPIAQTLILVGSFVPLIFMPPATQEVHVPVADLGCCEELES